MKYLIYIALFITAVIVNVCIILSLGGIYCSPCFANKTYVIYALTNDGDNGSPTGTWNQAHDSGGVCDINDTANDCKTYSNYYSSVPYNRYIIERATINFDTSNVKGTIISATLNLYADTVYDDYDDAYGYIAIVQNTNAAADGTLACGDFDAVGDAIDNPTQGGSLDLTNITATQYNVFTLDATGLTWINQSGYTKLGLREGHDCEDQELSGGTAVDYSGWFFETAESANPPYLEIVTDANDIVINGNVVADKLYIQ